MVAPQLPKESDKAYAAFLEYCRLGPERTLKAVGAKLGKSETMMERWSSKHTWQSRTVPYDDNQRELRRIAEEQALQEQSGIWARRAMEQRQKTWDRTQMLLKKVEEALGLPLTKKVVSQDGKQITVNPTKWSFDGMVRALQIIENLQRLCLNLPTEKTELTGPDNTPLAIQASPVVIFIPDNGRDKGEAKS